MNAEETIAAAIEKLEKLRGAATPAPWDFYGGEPFGYGIGFPVGLVVHRDEITDEDAELIVTLHRTIDAQLAILQESKTWGISDATIDLARAIL